MAPILNGAVDTSVLRPGSEEAMGEIDAAALAESCASMAKVKTTLQSLHTTYSPSGHDQVQHFFPSMYALACAKQMFDALSRAFFAQPSMEAPIIEGIEANCLAHEASNI